jgi:hypothetical protein
VIWIPIGAWLGAVVLAVLVLGFLAYEVTWKSSRLVGELNRLGEVGQQLQDVQVQVAAAQERLAAARVG